MKKYEVLVGGRNYLIEIDGIKCRAGFYTKRYVWAENPANAEQKALRLVRNELQEQGMMHSGTSLSPSLYIDEIHQLSFASILRTLFRNAGRGATWYREETL